MPLDYLDPTAGKAKIALGRYNATSGTRKGSVFLNPGGPGGPGVDLATYVGPRFQRLVSFKRVICALYTYRSRLERTTISSDSTRGALGRPSGHFTSLVPIICFRSRLAPPRPQTLCFQQPGSRTAFIANTVLDRGYDSSANLSDANNRYHLVETQRDANALYKTQFAICSQTMGDAIKYMGTSTVARDIDYLTTLLDGEDALMYVVTLKASHDV